MASLWRDNAAFRQYNFDCPPWLGRPLVVVVVVLLVPQGRPPNEAGGGEIRGRPKVQKGVCLPVVALGVEGEPPELVLPLAPQYHSLGALNSMISASSGGVIGETDFRVEITVVVIIVVRLSPRIEMRPVVAVDDQDA